ncbi:AraC-type DNA-binding protein [Flagellimonas flava]|uniref:AraC-type DNA-binding protein n=2 Tax=Flagellimonas flava TaxID=570519 RepID=A0A1M5MKK5_9FLAO|nr:AraC-type DNA-binding protein [Allomuricauda flava]
MDSRFSFPRSLYFWVMGQDVVLLVLSCLGIAQALFLISYLLTLGKPDDRTSFFLAMVILGLTIRIGKSILNVHLDLEPWQRNLGISGVLLTGPFLWFYTKGLLVNFKALRRKDYLHLLPFFFFVLFAAIIPNDGRAISYLIYVLVFVHLACYLGLSLSVLITNGENVHRQRSTWVRNLIIGVGLIWIFYMGNLGGIFPFYIGGAVSFSFLIYIFSFLFLQKHAFRLGKYNASTMDKSHSSALFGSIKTMLVEEELFLDPKLSLESMAKKMGVSPRKLSQAINENGHKNFSEFVNDHRIEKAKKLLSDPEQAQEKIAGIAYDCGFGNVTSFNLAFKARNHQTPSSFRKKALLASG